MMRSMFSGVSGLRIHQTKMDVIANNIANVNTVGYKSSRVTFRDAFYQNLSGASGANPVTGRTGTNPMQIGLGANVASIDNIMTQGLSQRTDNAMDVMIQGNGFFIVKDTTGTYFTRAGNISRDASNNLNINGMQLMGWDTKVGSDGQPEIAKGPVVPLTLSGDKQNVPPKPTSLIDIAGNLNMNEMVTREINGVDCPTVTTNFAFYDSDGNQYTADVRFTYYPEATDTPDHKSGFWEFEFMPGSVDDNPSQQGVMVYKEDDREDGGKLVGLNLGDLPTTANTQLLDLVPKGVLSFDTDGKLLGWVSSTTPTATQDANGNWTAAATGTSVYTGSNITALTPAQKETLRGEMSLNTKIMELYIAPSDVLDPTATFGTPQDGMNVTYTYTAAAGATPSTTTGAIGGTAGAASLTKPIGRMELDFADLNQWGGDNFSLTPVMANGNAPGTLQDLSVGSDGKITGRYSNGQQKLLGQIAVAQFSNPAGLQKAGNNLYTVTANSGPFDGIGSTGDLLGGSLEMSNVDLSAEFTDMITTQRGFQANSRVITVSDEMLQELVNLKR